MGCCSDCSQNNLVRIDIVLENCEEFNIPADYITDFVIKSSVFFSLKSRKVELHSSQIRVRSVELAIKELDDIFPSRVMGHSADSLIKERITSEGDITQIHCHYIDGTVVWFYVPWGSEDGSINPYQDVEIEDGVMTIRIG